eukprot:COSAG04_NODE_12761_length_636_cov_1.143389_1_plen_147_part_00
MYEFQARIAWECLANEKSRADAIYIDHAKEEDGDAREVAAGDELEAVSSGASEQSEEWQAVQSPEAAELSSPADPSNAAAASLQCDGEVQAFLREHELQRYTTDIAAAGGTALAHLREASEIDLAPLRDKMPPLHFRSLLRAVGGL